MSDRSIFLAALDIADPVARSAYLDEACAAEPDLRSQVEQLLAAHGEASGFMLRPAPTLLATLDEPIAERPGTIIGHYKLLEKIGEGGFGVVFMAEQQEPVRRKVALKVLKPGMDTRQVVARFEAERQALAVMDHPNIAHVFDGGTTGTGRPYFVMDLVRGIPITEYCDQNLLAPRERLELFVQVCGAIQHAHQKGIIHRDVKPSNVLVTLHDGAALVKVIDFGVAKALGQQLTDKTLFTGFAQLVGTPLYMSPEQAALSNVDVDTRSDIYSLGVLLYELLTGTTPFAKDRFSEAGYDELRRIIREEEPPKPSTRISTLGQAADTISAQRKSDTRRLSQLVRGELDWIVMKCLEKDRNWRYETSSALAADVQHYLHDEPVQACPPSVWYRFRKLARRKKTAVVVAACVFLALSGIAGAVGWAVRDRAAREEGIERERLAREQALDEAVQAILDETRPLIDEGKWPEALAVVERADNLLKVASVSARPPRLAELQRELTMAQRLENIYRMPKRVQETSVLISVPGELSTAEPLADIDGQAKRQRNEITRISGEQATVVTSRTQQDAEEEFFRGREQDAEFSKAFREFGIDIDSLVPAEAAAKIRRHSVRLALVKALDDWAPLRRRARGDNDPGWKNLMEIARQADSDDWRNRCRDGLLRRDRQALEELADAVPIRQVPPATLWQLGDALLQVGAQDKAMDLLRRAHHAYPSDLWINDALAWFSWTAFQPPHYDDAVRFYTAVLAVRPHLASVHKLLADVFQAKGAAEQAKAEHEQAVAEYSSVIELDPKNAEAWFLRGIAYSDLHQYDKAIADFSKAIELEPNQVAAWDQRARACSALGQHDKAIADYTKEIELNPTFAATWNNRGVDHQCLGHYDKAMADYTKAIELAPNDSMFWNNRGLAYYNDHQYDHAIAEFSKVIELEPKNAGAWYSRGNTYYELRQYDKAIADYTKSVELDAKFSWSWKARGDAYYMLRQYDKAIADFSKRIELEPNNADASYDRGRAHCAVGQHDDAIADLTKAIELEPKTAFRWQNRAGVYYQNLHQYDKALADISKAIELDPKGAGWYCRGLIFRAVNQDDKAIADFSKAIELEPKYARAWSQRGRSHAIQGRLNNASADFEKATELDPDDAEVWMEYACLLVLQRDNDGYRQVCQRVLERFSQSTDPNILYIVSRTCALAPSAVPDPDQPVKLAEQAVASQPKLAWYLHTLGLAHYRAGQFEQAVGRFNESMEVDPGWCHVLDWLPLAMAHFRLGHAEEAQRWLDKAVEWIDKTPLDPDGTLPVGSFSDLLEVQLLRREAEAMLKKSVTETGP